MRLFRLTLFLILAPSAVAVTTPAQAETGLADAPRPLNLSLPRDALDARGASQDDDTVQRNLRAPGPGARDVPSQPRLPYGAGWELRQQDMAAPNAGAPPRGGTASPGAGAGRRGR